MGSMKGAVTKHVRLRLGLGLGCGVQLQGCEHATDLGRVGLGVCVPASID